jgi:hypothetical protein
MLCKTCENLPLPTNVAGSCKSCPANTSYFAYKLCEDCSEELDQCERCEAPLSAASSPVQTPGTTRYRVTLNDSDHGKTIAGMHPGEEVAVVLKEDQYSQVEWGVDNYSLPTGIKLKANNGFVPYPNQYQHGTRELVFELTTTGKLNLEIVEMIRTWSWHGNQSSTTPAPNGKKWKCTIQST